MVGDYTTIDRNLLFEDLAVVSEVIGGGGAQTEFIIGVFKKNAIGKGSKTAVLRIKTEDANRSQIASLE